MRSLSSRSRFLTWILASQIVFSLPVQALAQTTSTTSSASDLSTSSTPDDLVNFNPNYILDDSDIFGLGDMRLGDVQSFLDSRPGVLATYKTRDTDGVIRSAAEIIWRIATTYQINPRYLLALMQKEQSLVDDPHPTQKQFDWATGYSICDSCSMNDPRLQEFKGMPSQLEWAAKQHRERYLMQILGKGSTIAGIARGKTLTISGQQITPMNNATAMLYSYTPHIHGNLNLWQIWQRWFALHFPEGTVVRGNSTGNIYLLRANERRSIKNIAIAASLVDIDKIVNVQDSRLSSYHLGLPVNFPNFSLVQTPDKKRYLLSGTSKRYIKGKAFDRFGFNEDEVLDVRPDDLSGYQDGPDITTSTTYPTGLLVKDAQKHYWYVENNVRRFIPDATFLSLYFRGRRPRVWTTKQLNAVTEGQPYGLQDGELIRGKKSSDVFVMENGLRRPIATEKDFKELGYAWKNVVTLPDKLVTTYPLGEPVDPHGAPPTPFDDTQLVNTTTTPTTLATAVTPLTH